MSRIIFFEKVPDIRNRQRIPSIGSEKEFPASDLPLKWAKWNASRFSDRELLNWYDTFCG